MNDPIWTSVYLGLIIGAPIVFFYFVKQKRQDDLNEVVSYIEDQIQKERKGEATSYAEDFRKMKEEIKRLEGLVRQKDLGLKEKEAELDKIKPLLKYLREPPSGGTPS